MTKRGPRPVVFVCVSVDPDKPGDVISRQIQATSQNEAASFFFEQTGFKAKVVHGPYRPKRAQVFENTRTLRFSDIQKMAIYDNWEVKACFLLEPADSAYLLFLRRTDGKKQPQPQGTIIVPLSDLRFDNEQNVSK